MRRGAVVHRHPSHDQRRRCWEMEPGPFHEGRPYAEQLQIAGVRNVVVLPDNDDVGRRHAEEVAHACQDAGLAVKVVALPGLSPKGDIVDYLRDRTKADLNALVKATALWGHPETVPVTTVDHPSDRHRVLNTRNATGNVPPPSEERYAVFTRLSDVEREEVSWHWRGRTARGKTTLLLGDPGLGKSWFACDMTARTTRGAAWPDEGTAPCGDVIVMTAEDGLGDTVRPRIEDLGGDLSRVHVLTAIRDREGNEFTFSLGRDLPLLEAKIVETGAVLVTIDPFSAYLGAADSHRDAEIRRVLTPLAVLAERTGVAVVAVMHLTKDDKRRAVSRGLGSMAFVAASRVTLAVGRDPDDNDPNGRRILVPVKSNLSEPAPALAFRLTDGRFCWDVPPRTAVDVDEVLGGVHSEDRAEQEDARVSLREALAAGPVFSKDIERDAKANGISQRTLFRAKSSLGVQARKVGFASAGKWYWSVPAEGDTSKTASPQTPKAATPNPVAPLGGEGPIKAIEIGVSVKAANADDVAALARGAPVDDGHAGGAKAATLEDVAALTPTPGNIDEHESSAAKAATPRPVAALAAANRETDAPFREF